MDSLLGVDNNNCIVDVNKDDKNNDDNEIPLIQLA